MKYLYTCDECNKEITIDKHNTKSSKIEHCECGKELRRIYTSTGIKTSDGIKGANH